MESLSALHDAFVEWFANGWLDATWWQVLLFALATTHVTIASVTIFLHRSQAHRSLDLHPAVQHFFRFWLWIATGMVTKEWVAIHRKHHAKCETVDDPHSPQTHGIRKVLWEGAELYRNESHVPETMVKYGHGTPDDWIERHVYSRFTWQGVGLMLVLNLFLFGALGAAVWAVQMVWIPFFAAGVINGLGHWWGYRNFEAPDASTNISPWGILIGGEELHNNHHTYPTSARFSVKRGEFDIGWLYIQGLSALGLATVRKTPPKLAQGHLKPQADGQTLETLIAARYEVMASYAKAMRAAVGAEIERLQSQGAAAGGRVAAGGASLRVRDLRIAKTWLHRDAERIPLGVMPHLETAVGASPKLAQWVAMREQLRSLWTRTNVSAEQLVADLQAWCHAAETSGITALRDFSLRLRAARLQPA
jgi:stearoyl-CoA desaturase (delta-9 desaturase)